MLLPPFEKIDRLRGEIKNNVLSQLSAAVGYTVWGMRTDIVEITGSVKELMRREMRWGEDGIT
jgi:hypothetical protein